MTLVVALLGMVAATYAASGGEIFTEKWYIPLLLFAELLLASASPTVFLVDYTIT